VTSLYMALAAAAAIAASGLPSCFMGRRSRAAQIAATAAVSAGGALGLAAIVLFLARGEPSASLSARWAIPWGGFSVGLDPLGSVFLALAFLVPPLGSIFGLAYWRRDRRPRSSRRLEPAYGLLAGAMAMVVLSRDGILFLMSWEVMALAGFFAATAADDGPGLRRGGWIYLVAAHVGALCLFAMFALWRSATGSFSLSAAPLVGAGAQAALFALALVGFGFKAGFVPLHFWLPDAHAGAPSHVSAVMSGVMLNMGIYGILRMLSLLPAGPAWQGETLIAVGALSGVMGIVFATAQRDMKRVLAYSSVENLGIIAMGAGLGFLGRSLGRPELVALGLGGALLHTWNHGLFKSLLFLGSGAVMHAAGTRDMERLGGLAKRMPVLATLFLIGSVAICALPPLNGFASELLVYLGFFRAVLPGGDPSLGPAAAASSGALAVAGAAAAAALAMIGALAVACFVRLYSTVFLGEGRSEAAARARECGVPMLIPMALLAAACLAVGVAPSLVLGTVQRAAASWQAADPTAAALPDIGSLAPAAFACGLGAAISAALAIAWAASRAYGRLRERGRGRAAAEPAAATGAAARPTWDCGYAAPTSRMQYTASSFGDAIVSLFAGFLKPRSERVVGRAFFPAARRYEEPLPDAALERAAAPFSKAASRILPKLRSFQTGSIQSYILYMLVMTIALLALGDLGAPR
jgi:hydrogenase-4 component B